ncbi:MAG: hypothetical protein ABI233_04015 [Chthoniobacterales bacterium]
MADEEKTATCSEIPYGSGLARGGLGAVDAGVALSFRCRRFRLWQNQSLFGLRGRLEIWNRWDAKSYLELAQFGYKPPGPLREFSVVHFPLYPWFVRIGSYLTSDYLASAFLVSGLALLVGAILLRLIALDFEAPVALRAVWFFLIFPSAYFLHVPYAESLFIALVLGAFMATRANRWWLAGILGALVCLTRPPGIVIIPALGVEVIHQWWKTRRWQHRWLWLLLAPCGFAAYMWLSQWALGDPLAFLRLRRDFFHVSLAPPWIGLYNAWGNRGQFGTAGEMVGNQEFIFCLLGLVFTIVSWFRLRPSYATWMTGNWLLFTSTTYLQSVPRYTLTLFPMFILFGFIGEKNRFWNALITVWSLLYLALFSTAFVRGLWAF